MNIPSQCELKSSSTPYFSSVVQVLELPELHSTQQRSGARFPGASRARPTLLPAPRGTPVTIPSKLHRQLVERSDREGRSLSNLVAFLLETALH